MTSGGLCPKGMRRQEGDMPRWTRWFDDAPPPIRAGRKPDDFNTIILYGRRRLLSTPNLQKTQKKVLKTPIFSVIVPFSEQ